MSLCAPQVSVVIPSYNRLAMLQEAVESVLAQNEVEFEVIIIDDGSTDKTPTYLENLARGNPLVRAEQVANRGPAAARNRGVELARAPLIAFLDSDDLWAPAKLARQLAFMARDPACEIAQCQETWIRDGRRVNPGLRHQKQAGDFFIPSLRTCLVSPSAVMMRTEFFRTMGGFDEALAAAEDYDLWLRILVDHEIGLHDEFLVTRRAGHADQLSAMPAIDRFRILALMKLLASQQLPIAKRIAASDAMAEKCRIYANGLRRRGNEAAANFFDEIASSALTSWRAAPDPRASDALDQLRTLLARQCARVNR